MRFPFVVIPSSVSSTAPSKRLASPTRSPKIMLKQLTLAISTISASTIVMAAGPSMSQGTDGLPEVELDAITVTATRTSTRISNTIAQTRVIDSDTLKRYTGETVLDVLQREPGINIVQNGGLGTSSNFYMRGYGSNSVLILIDGIRYSSISLGTPALNLLPAEQIDRIEVLYGASGSSIYGSDAMGGVIQIFTKGTNAQQSQFSVAAGGGSHDHYLYGASAQLVNDTGTRLSISANRNETKGINATLDDPSNPYSQYNPDDDGYESNNYSLLLNQRINEDLTAGISGLYSDSTTEFDNGETPAHSDQKNGAAQAFVDWQYAPYSSIKLSYGQSVDDSETTSSYSSEFETKQKQVSLVGYHALPIGEGVYGAEYLKQELDATAYSADDRKVTSGFLGYMASYDNFNMQANVRYDNYSDFDDETTYNLGAAYRLTPEWRIGADYAKGFRAPTFNDLYYPGSGNANLAPETSDNYEAFIEYDTLLNTTRITGYRNKVDDLITYVATPTPDNQYAGEMVNTNKADIKGVTLTSDWFIDDYTFGLSYDYQKSKDDSGGANDDNYLAFRPENKATIYAGYQLPSFNVRAEYEYVDNYYSGNANLESQKVDNYDLVNISGSYYLTPQMTLTARLNNVFNEKYVTTPGYNTDGTNFMTALTFNWQ